MRPTLSLRFWHFHETSLMRSLSRLVRSLEDTPSKLLRRKCIKTQDQLKWKFMVTVNLHRLRLTRERPTRVCVHIVCLQGCFQKGLEGSLEVRRPTINVVASPIAYEPNKEEVMWAATWIPLCLLAAGVGSPDATYFCLTPLCCSCQGILSQ